MKDFESIVKMKKSRHELAEKYTKRAEEIAKSAEPVSDEDRSELAQMKADIADHDERIGMCEDALQIAKTIPVDKDDMDDMDDGKSYRSTYKDAERANKSGNTFNPVRSNVVIKGASRKLKAGEAYAMAALAKYVAKDKGNLEAGVDYIRNELRSYDVAKEFEHVQKASAMGYSLDSTGGALQPPGYIQEVIDLLWSNTVLDKIGVNEVPMPFAQAIVPRFASASTSYWVAENSPIPASNPTTDQIDMAARAIANTVALSKQLVYASPFSVLQQVQHIQTNDLARVIDKTCLYGAATSGQPTGIFNQMASTNALTQVALPSGEPAGALPVVLQNLNALLAQFTTQNVDTEGAHFVMHPSVVAFLRTVTDQVGRPYFDEQLSAGRLLGLGYQTTTQTPTNLGSSTKDTLIGLIQPRYVSIGKFVPIEVDINEYGSYQLNGTLNSALANIQVVIRAWSSLDIALQHNFAVTSMQVTGWYSNVANVGSAGTEFNTQALQQNALQDQASNPTG